MVKLKPEKVLDWDVASESRYQRIAQLLTQLGALIFGAFLPFCFLYPHPSTQMVGYFVLLSLLACFVGMWLNSKNLFLHAKNAVSLTVILLYTVSPILLGSAVLDGTLLLVFPATMFFAYPPRERIYAFIWISTALLGYLTVLIVGGAMPFWGPGFPPSIAFSVDSAAKLTLFGFIAVICYSAARQISLHESALADSLKTSENLLLNILPAPIVARLKHSSEAIADRHDIVAVLFVDIASFTPLSEKVSPDELVAFLNQVFSTFDAIVRKLGIEKIKTIGDAYMVAAGVPQESPGSLAAIAQCALEMSQAAQELKDPLGQPLQLRMGIHCGPAVAGVIGAHKFAYDLWGDTVNTASRMESHGEVGKIHVSEDVFHHLRQQFRFVHRGEVLIKGKGPLQTWWLVSEENEDDSEEH